MRLVVIVRISRLLDGVLDKLLECPALTDEFYEFGNATATAKHNKFLFFQEELLNRAALVLIQELINLYVASVIN